MADIEDLCDSITSLRVSDVPPTVSGPLQILPRTSTIISTSRSLSQLQCLLSTLPRLVIQNSSHPPLREFHLFKRLPAELRVKIWGYAASHPRVVIVNSRYSEYAKKVWGQTRHPGILRANREARHGGLKSYERFYEKPRMVRQINREGKIIEKLSRVRKAVYVNFAVDLFRFPAFWDRFYDFEVRSNQTWHPRPKYGIEL